MSWKQFVDHLVDQGLAHAVFIGDDLAVWASSEGFNLSGAERRAMFDAFEKPGQVFESGLALAGRHFSAVAADDRIVKVAQGRNGAMLVKMRNFIIVGEYGALPPAQAQHFINKVAEQLTMRGY